VGDVGLAAFRLLLRIAVSYFRDRQMSG
jgi:hypothetical protein